MKEAAGVAGGLSLSMASGETATLVRHDQGSSATAHQKANFAPNVNF
jgi:hypothetical protein